MPISSTSSTPDPTTPCKEENFFPVLLTIRDPNGLQYYQCHVCYILIWLEVVYGNDLGRVWKALTNGFGDERERVYGLGGNLGRRISKVERKLVKITINKIGGRACAAIHGGNELWDGILGGFVTMIMIKRFLLGC
jgi:hypothetical protein